MLRLITYIGLKMKIELLPKLMFFSGKKHQSPNFGLLQDGWELDTHILPRVVSRRVGIDPYPHRPHPAAHHPPPAANKPIADQNCAKQDQNWVKN